MHWINTLRGYGLVSRSFHAIVALCIIVQLSIGFWMVDLPNNLKSDTYANHKTAGLIILSLVIMRFLWRMFNIIPQLPANTPLWQIIASRSLHLFFNFLMFAMPISGWIMSTAAGYLPSLGFIGKVAFPFFTNDEFCILGMCQSSQFVGDMTHDLHAIGGWIFASALLIHITVAIWHGYLKDGVLSRIWFDRTQ